MKSPSKTILGGFLGLLGLLASVCHATCDPSLLPSATSRAGLSIPQINSCGWGAQTNANWNIVDSSMCLLSGTNAMAGTYNFSGTPNLYHGTKLNFQDVTGSFSSQIWNNTSGALQLTLLATNVDINGSNYAGGSGFASALDLAIFPQNGLSTSYGTFAVIGSSANGIGTYSGFTGTSPVSQSILWSLPTKDGTNGQAIITDGSSHLSFAGPYSSLSGTNIFTGAGNQFTNNLTVSSLNTPGPITVTSSGADLIFGSGNTFTINIPSINSTRLYSLLDVGSDSNFVMDHSSATFTGPQIFISSITMKSSLSVSSNTILPGATFYQGAPTAITQVNSPFFASAGGQSIYGNFIASTTVTSASSMTVTLSGNYTHYVTRITASNASATNGVTLFLRFNNDAASLYTYSNSGFLVGTSTGNFCGASSANMLTLTNVNNIVQNSGLYANATLNIDVLGKTWVNGTVLYFETSGSAASNVSFAGAYSSASPTSIQVWMGVLSSCTSVTDLLTGTTGTMEVWGVF
jgi:hypothetical protein